MQKRRVILADDDIDDREMFEEILAGNPQVDLIGGVENGQELLARLGDLETAALPDLIVLDHNMPKMNGLQTLEALKKDDRFKDIPAVMFSTYCDSKLIEQSEALGAALVFTKPSSFYEYQQMIHDFLAIIPN
ncbi:MAG: response regulator [Flavitalea sp.]